MCTVHVLHARRWTTEGDKGKNYLWWWAWIDGLTVVLVADLAVVLLRPSSSSSLRFSSALFASVSVSSFCFSRGCCRLGGQWQLAVMLVAVERNPTMPHGGYEGGSGWEARWQQRFSSSSSPCRGAGCCLFFNGAATGGRKMMSWGRLTMAWAVLLCCAPGGVGVAAAGCGHSSSSLLSLLLLSVSVTLFLSKQFSVSLSRFPLLFLFSPLYL